MISNSNLFLTFIATLHYWSTFIIRKHF